MNKNLCYFLIVLGAASAIMAIYRSIFIELDWFELITSTIVGIGLIISCSKRLKEIEKMN